MALVKGIIATPLVKFILDSQKGGKVSDPKAAAQAFAEELESLVFKAILSVSATVPAGIAVATSGGAGATTAVAKVILK